MGAFVFVMIYLVSYFKVNIIITKMEEFYRDFDWELDRFVEYRLPIKKPF